MKQSTIFYILLFVLTMGFRSSIAQTSLPIKDKGKIKAITEVVTYKYDLVFDYTDTRHHEKSIYCWVTKYHGKWYSNYPYTIKTKGDGVFLIYKDNKLIKVDSSFNKILPKHTPFKSNINTQSI